MCIKKQNSFKNNEKILIVYIIDDHVQQLSPGFNAISASFDILVIIDGQDYTPLISLFKDSNIHFLINEEPFGYGTCLMSAAKYAIDLNYILLIFHDLRSDTYLDDIEAISENYSYGYDIINLSRILENPDYSEIPAEFIQFSTILHDKLFAMYHCDLTDPLSPIKGIGVDIMRKMMLTEDDVSIFIQLWIQSYSQGLSIIEIPTNSRYDWFKYSLETIDFERIEYVLESESILANIGEIDTNMSSTH